MSTLAKPAPLSAPAAVSAYKPIDEKDADSLRAFVPTEKLLEIERLAASAGALYKLKRREYEEAKAAAAAAKIAIQKARAVEKAAKAKIEVYFRLNFWAELDAARDAALAEAQRARLDAILKGEPIRYETLEQCTARVEAARDAA